MISRAAKVLLSILSCAISASAVTACSGPANSDPESFQIAGRHYSSDNLIQYKLPKVLREISGLTLDGNEQLFGHGDEFGIIYGIDYSQGKLVDRSILQGQIQADFEGIAAAGDKLFLITSNGTLYETLNSGAELTFDRHTTDIDCEIEGLTYQQSDDTLLIACKNLPDRDVAVKIYRWDLATASLDRSAMVSIPHAELAGFLDSEKSRIKIQPTGLTTTDTGNLLILAGRQHLLLEFTASGEPVASAKLSKSRHRQAEGIALTGDGLLLIADEGDGKGNKKSRGRLSVYRPTE